MKKWFLNLEKKQKNRIYGILGIIILISVLVIGVSDNESIGSIFSLFFVIALIFIIVFIVWDKKAANDRLPKNNTNKIEPKTTLTQKIDKFDANDWSTNVKIIDEDGNEEFVPNYYCLKNKDLCLVVENGKTYHTHCACYKNWKQEYISNFNGTYKLISIEEVKKQGLKKCKFCEINDMSQEERLNYEVKGRKYILTKLTNNKSKEVQEVLCCISPFDKVELNIDEDNKVCANISYDFVGNVKVSSLKPLDLEEFDDVIACDAFVYTIEENPETDKIEITIAICK